MNAPDDDATSLIKAAYDAVDYDCSAYPASHPDHLATMAALLGIEPPLLATARVLEIGCGDGTNLIPVAAAWPGATFVGCDLAPRAVESGERFVRELGLANIALLVQDIRTLPASLGNFDYIIAHGFYSWVPRDVREALMALIAERLSPTGVAFVSYNAHPGSRIRQIGWDALHFHVDRIEGAPAKLAAGRQFLAMLGEPQQAHWKPDQLLRAEYADLATRGDSALWHDDLAVPNEAFYFQDFAAHAQRHGLHYLGESEARFMGGSGLALSVRRLIASEPDRLRREQYLDFARFRRFRQTLLTKAESVSGWAFIPARITGMQVSAAATLMRSMADAEAQGKPRESVLRDGDPLVHKMLLWLAELSPRNVTTDDIARWRGQHTPNDARPLEPLLAELFVGGVIDLSLQPTPLVTAVSEKPLASPVARAMARTRQRVVNLRHEMVNLSDPAARQLLQLLDGTRNRRALLEALGPQFTRGSDGLEAMLRFCGRVSLLSA